MHEVARELEDPFTHPPNDLPAVDLQAEFNQRLLTAWDGCGAGDAVGGLGELRATDGVEELMASRAQRQRDASWRNKSVAGLALAEGIGGPAAHLSGPPLPMLARQGSRPNRFWEISSSSGSLQSLSARGPIGEAPPEPILSRHHSMPAASVATTSSPALL